MLLSDNVDIFKFIVQVNLESTHDCAEVHLIKTEKCDLRDSVSSKIPLDKLKTLC